MSAAGGESLGQRPWPADLIRLRTRAPEITISHGDTALVIGNNGSVEMQGDGHGLYVHETRMLCRHQFRIGRQRPIPVSHSAVCQDRWLGYFIVAAPGAPVGEGESPEQAAARETLELQVLRTVGDGLHEDVTLSNHSPRRIRTTLVVQADADFRGPDEVHAPRKPRGRISRTLEDTPRGWQHVWRLQAEHRSQGDGRLRRIDRSLRLRVRSSSPATLHEGRFSFAIDLAPGEQWQACLEWSAIVDGQALPSPPCGRAPARDDDERKRPHFLDHATAFRSPESDSAATWLVPALERARRDLHALRLHRLDTDRDAWTVAAGVPAYMGLFGRDALTAGFQSTILGPEILAGSLGALAACQGTRRDDWRDEMPGRVLHEARVDPAAALDERPTGRYYGSLTSSSLFALAVAEYWRWTGDRVRTQAWLEPALAGLRWLNQETRQVQGVFHATTTRSPKGLDNQTWKDSSESVVDADGRVVEQPVATCEEQGIAYLAQCELASVLDALGQAGEARALRVQAQQLKRRFNDAYWLEDEGYFAMALDRQGQPVRSLGSNALRCLGSGVVDEALAARMAERAFQADLFSGWGMRTLAAGHPAYNPYGYHRGCVWPVEHGPFAVGLRRYGLAEPLQKIARAQMELLRLFEGFRLPECVAGHARSEQQPFPAVFPAANAPQAWSATTPLLLLEALLGLEADAPAQCLRVDPWLPEWLPQISLTGLRVGQARVDLRFWRDLEGNSHHAVIDCEGRLKVERRASQWRDCVAG